MPIDLLAYGPERFSSRELSRLEFGARLLDLADDHRLPILERFKFVAIFADMIDEFFQVRVVSLEDKVAAGVQTPSVDGVRPRQQLAAIRERVLSLVERQDRIVLDTLLPELAKSGIQVVHYRDLDEVEKKHLNKYFDENVYPVLTPLAVDPGHPFPMISNLSLNIAVTVGDDSTGEERSARVKVPNSLPRFLQVAENRWCLLEDLIMENLDRLFPGMRIGRADLFRVTRNADLTLEEDEADDLLVALEVELRRRRFGEALRVEIQSGMSPDYLDLLVAQLEIDRSNVYVTDAPLGLHDLWSLYAIDRPDLKGEGWSPITPRRLLDGDHVGDIFAAIKEGDILLHHPYESFTDSVEVFSNSLFHGLVAQTSPSGLLPAIGGAGIVGPVYSGSVVESGLAPASAFTLDVDGKAARRQTFDGWAPSYQVGTYSATPTAKLVLHRLPLNGLLALFTLVLWATVWLGFGWVQRFEWLFTSRARRSAARHAKRGHE